MANTTQSEFMCHNEHIAAHKLGLSVSTMRQYRLKGGGPRFLKFGRAVRYTNEDLESWARARLFENTSQVG